ncbi:MAG: DUF1844 domain-containing protein [Pyrinomonadaceae bacterium]
MIGREDPNSEEPELKVTDRRKFNVDGSLRDGVVIEKQDAPEVAVVDDADFGESESEPAMSDAQMDEMAPEDSIGDAAVEEEDDLEDERDPASFINFLSTLVTNAAASLGAIPHPVTGQKSADLESGRYWIDVLTMLRKKTKGNLSSREDSLLASVLSDLQLQYVTLSRVAEEKLKAQAAQKFSSKDILGG